MNKVQMMILNAKPVLILKAFGHRGMFDPDTIFTWDCPSHGRLSQCQVFRIANIREKTNVCDVWFEFGGGCSCDDSDVFASPRRDFFVVPVLLSV